MGIFFGGSFLGGNYPVGVTRVEIFRVGVFMLQRNLQISVFEKNKVLRNI